MQEYPKYFSIRDTAKFWEDEMNDYLGKGDMLLKDKKRFSNFISEDCIATSS